MGFSTLLDILGSMIIGGIILTLMGKINSNIVDNTVNNNSAFNSQQKLSNITLLLESDLKKIGYCADYTAEYKFEDCVLAAETNKITFLYDYNLNGTMDTISYYMGSTTELSSTHNPEDRYFYKKINKQTPVALTDGVTSFQMNYYNSLDSLLSAPVVNKASIVSFEMNLTIEPGDSVKAIAQTGGDPFPPLFLKQTRISQRNLFNR